MRLDRFVCKSTNLSRQEAKDVINSGRVQVDKLKDIHEGFQVHVYQHITLDGTKLIPRPSRYILLHKPEGYISSNVDARYPSLFKLLPELDTDNLHIAGRLDRDTTGLVLITDDGRWSFNIISPDSDCPKTYLVTLQKPILAEAITQLQNGVILKGLEQRTRPAIVKVLNDNLIELTISEGKYHQVKRMLRAVNNKVIALHRAQIGPLELDIEEGEWRYLTEQEVSYFSPPPLSLQAE